MAQAHRVTAAVPAVEIAHDGNTAGIWRPYGEPHTRHAIHNHLMCAETLSEVAVLAFREQVYVEFAQQRSEGIRILGFLDWAAPVDAQQVCPRTRAWADE